MKSSEDFVCNVIVSLKTISPKYRRVAVNCGIRTINSHKEKLDQI
jgi:hypothetical protein